MSAKAVHYSETREITLESVVALYRANKWSSAEKPELLLKALSASHSLVTAWDGSKLIGLGNAISDGYLVVYYPHLLVLPEYQGCGVGSQLMRMLMSKYHGFHQHMLIADGRALDFYRKCGFERAGRTEPMWIYAGHDHQSTIALMITHPYKTRPIRFLELWQAGEWRIKVYSIAYERPVVRAELVEAAKSIAREKLATVPSTLQHYSVGFLGVHDGRTSNFVFVDWWAEENELHHHVYVSPSNDLARLTDMTPTGLTACVWDLRVMGFERKAWLEAVLRNPNGPDLEAYLRERLNEDV